MHLPGSALEGRAVFEGEGQAAIRVSRGVVQQAAPELLAEGGDLAVLLLENPEEVLHRAAPVEDVAARRAALGDRYDVYSMRELGVEMDVEENGETFEENALIKAKALMDVVNCATLADDSGLCVDQLGGRPGVHSARYCGVHGDDEANNQLLLKELADKPAPHKAHYGAAVALCRPGREPVTVYGRCDGEIIGEYRGEGGFGYDPLFLSDDLGVTFAEADAEAKNGVSHRARAIAKLIDVLEGEA